MKGAPRVLGAQEFTRQLKNRVLAKSAPPAADQKFNTVATSILGNRSNQVVKLVNEPSKSCSGGWTDESGCCTYSVVVDITGGCACSALAAQVGCPGPVVLSPFSSPQSVITITVNEFGFTGTAGGAFILVDPAVDYDSATVTIDGNPASIFSSIGFGATIVGVFTAASTIVVTLPEPVNELSAFCPYPELL